VFRETAPFRADPVGSLLRPPELKAARASYQAGTIDAAALKAVEDSAIEAVIAKQAGVGLCSATDGEFRRAMCHFDFLERLDGCEPFTPDHGIAFKGVATRAKGVRVTGKLGFSGHPMLDHFTFLAARARGATPKMTIPSPSVLHFRGGIKPSAKRSIPISTISTPTSAAPTTARSTLSRTPAAGISNWMKPTSLICATPNSARLSATAVRTRTASPEFTPA
jgi:hypothetical protein